MKFQILLLILFSMSAQAESNLGPVDFSGYMRASTGTNTHGGMQQCFYNQSASANEFRLGNECGIYSEIGLAYNHWRSQKNDPSFFRTQFRFAFSPEGYRLWDRIPASTANDHDKAFANRGLNMVEVYSQGGNFADFPMEVWIGKRFYRDADAYIHDWFYFGDMSGVGAGLMKSSKDNHWALAHLIQGSESKSDKGYPAIQVIDFRWQENLADQREFHLWSAYGWSPSGENPSNTSEKYVAGQGEIVGVRIRQNRDGGFTDSAIIYGYGLLSSLNMYGSNPTNDNSLNKGSTWRWVLQDVRDNGRSWGLMSVAGWELRDNGKSADSQTEWQTVGFRPVYFFSDHRQLAVELGHSRIRAQSEYLGNGEARGWRELTRLTIAPQLSVKRGLWGRPVMRVYYTQSFWNTANKSSIGSSAPSFVDDVNGAAIGYQVEAWF